MNVGLFVSCLVDTARPEIGFAALELLEQAGATVTVPPQTCCGQPAYNNGNRNEAREIAKITLNAFEGLDYIVIPSASCAGMIKYHIPALLADDADYGPKARALAVKCLELTEFLNQTAPQSGAGATYDGAIYYHESCSARREMKAHAALSLLGHIKGAKVKALPENEACCGFGGLFSVKFDEISNAMVSKKIAPLKGAENAILTGVDLGCLLNLSGKMKQSGVAVPVYHIAEILAGRLTKGELLQRSL